MLFLSSASFEGTGLKRMTGEKHSNHKTFIEAECSFASHSVNIKTCLVSVYSIAV